MLKIQFCYGIICLFEYFSLILHVVKNACKVTTFFYNIQKKSRMKVKRIGILAILTLFWLAVSAQANHFVSLYGEVGESSYISKPVSLGVGGGAGVGYELLYDKFVFTTGVGINCTLTQFNIGDSVETTSVDTYKYHKRKDTYTGYAVQVPVLFGANIKRFYVLGGIKVNCCLKETTRIKAVADIDGGIGHESMGNIDIDELIENERVLTPNVLASLECGWRLGFYTTRKGFDVPKHNGFARLSLFVDYGGLGRNYPNRNVMHQLQAGLKLSYLFSLKPAGKGCSVCGTEGTDYQPKQRIGKKIKNDNVWF